MRIRWHSAEPNLFWLVKSRCYQRSLLTVTVKGLLGMFSPPKRTWITYVPGLGAVVEDVKGAVLVLHDFASTSVPSGVTTMQETFPFPAPLVFTTNPTSSTMPMVGPMPGPEDTDPWSCVSQDLPRDWFWRCASHYSIVSSWCVFNLENAEI